jgi:hypothetical protein
MPERHGYSNDSRKDQAEWLTPLFPVVRKRFVKVQYKIKLPQPKAVTTPKY